MKATPAVWPRRALRSPRSLDGANTHPVHRSAISDLDQAFAALADATRREMIRTLLQKPRRAGELARYVAMSPQALSRHLRVLRKAGLLIEQGLEDDARVRIYSVHAGAFEPVREWLAQVEDTHRARRGRS